MLVMCMRIKEIRVRLYTSYNAVWDDVDNITIGENDETSSMFDDETRQFVVWLRAAHESRIGIEMNKTKNENMKKCRRR